MLVQWPWGPQEAPERHSSTSVGMGISEGVLSRNTLMYPLGGEGSEEGDGKCFGLDMR